MWMDGDASNQLPTQHFVVLSCAPRTEYGRGWIATQSVGKFWAWAAETRGGDYQRS